ncbi:hypothetical protein FB45DRAFT_944613 [Roridomyces roridus]|uniref:DUF5648 domain-containing protein n=1 Tax=Roridomyces roridus TaxID=1738132 RepID=A0AAD7B3L3_9AGAR|nr:hypothetical protein FB45DRAFT_944613 [Roridomyces roridus]
MHAFSPVVGALLGICQWATTVRAEACADASKAVPLYRDFNGGIGDHFYTTDKAEYDAANQGGYTAEGARLSVFSQQYSGTVRFFRLWNGGLGDHFFTTNATEADSAATHNGYVHEDDKAPMWIYPDQLCGSVPLFRMYNNGASDHFYTIDAAERDDAAAHGWSFEWIAGYVFPAPGSAQISSSSSSTATTTTTASSVKSSTTPSTSASTGTVTSATPSGTSSAAPQPSNLADTGPVTPAATTDLSPSNAADTTPTGTAQNNGAPSMTSRPTSFLATLTLLGVVSGWWV